mgnify:CR=1 FL=1
MPEKRTAEGLERRAAAQRAKRKHLADLKEAARLATGKTISKEAQRAINHNDPRVTLRQRLDNNSHQFWWLASQEIGQEGRLDKLEALQGEHYSLMAQLADQNTLLRDALSLERRRMDVIETRLGMVAALLSGGETTQSLEELLAAL